MRFRDFNAQSLKRQQEIAGYFVRFGIERLSAKRRRRFHGRIQRLVWRELRQGVLKIPASKIKKAVLLWEKQSQGQRALFASRAQIKGSVLQAVS